ncbi:hypothetical protein K402DRAFT_419193 [Aulographum hederae CBS 113979]|uniref:Uncharacterized protein n=1 Tax=Aulographum hederae CBS 113979 TaxID=1176131 RepID=A0A6G1H748_9PEZI|nr:hypothetical protein K402DRAFT_419193 [Aulographum hederae CBS 113979]
MAHSKSSPSLSAVAGGLGTLSGLLLIILIFLLRRLRKQKAELHDLHDTLQRLAQPYTPPDTRNCHKDMPCMSSTCASINLDDLDLEKADLGRKSRRGSSVRAPGSSRPVSMRTLSGGAHHVPKGVTARTPRGSNGFLSPGGWARERRESGKTLVADERREVVERMRREEDRVRFTRRDEDVFEEREEAVVLPLDATAMPMVGC